MLPNTEETSAAAGDCIEDLSRSADFSAADAHEQVNRLPRKTALQRLVAYPREGNQALGVDSDKRNPTEGKYDTPMARSQSRRSDSTRVQRGNRDSPRVQHQIRA